MLGLMCEWATWARWTGYNGWEMNFVDIANLMKAVILGLDNKRLRGENIVYQTIESVTLAQLVRNSLKTREARKIEMEHRHNM